MVEYEQVQETAKEAVENKDDVNEVTKLVAQGKFEEARQYTGLNEEHFKELLETLNEALKQ